ncbi:alpha/beta hydrolase family protein [Pedobacter ginsengisoli]|nr:alpha/beta hydrolase [Pedobacter ginsengisoli]
MMKLYLFISFFCLSSRLFGQTTPDSTQVTEFTTENVKFKSAGITLSGTIFKPKHPQASLVLVHGSGQEKRMIKMATFLATKGIAVLTYDKRGAGESGGIYAGPEVATNNIDHNCGGKD